MSRKTKTRIGLTAAVVTLFAIAIATMALHSGARAAPADARHANEVIADRGSDTAPVVGGARVAGNGVVEPLGREAKLGLDVPGRVAEIFVREGEQVQAGALLARLDDEAERAALRIAESDVAIAEADLARTRAGTRREDVDAAAAEATASRARMMQSEDALARARTLAAAGAISDAELTRATRDAERDRAAFAAVDARRRSAAAGARVEETSVAKARLAAAEARRDQARVQLAQKTLRAPFAGTVLQVKLRVGERHSPEREPLVVLGDTRALVARIDVDERDIARVALGGGAFVTVPAEPGRRVRGKVVDVGQRMGRKNVRTDDPVERIDTKVLEVLVSLDDTRGLVPGLRVVGYLE